jgi:hypothetical protein
VETVPSAHWNGPPPLDAAVVAGVVAFGAGAVVPFGVGAGVVAGAVL